MELTDLQLDIQKLGADKSLSFGCIILMKDDYYDLCIGKITGLHNGLDYVFTTDIGVIGEVIEIIGHPITYSRLCYLNLTQSSDKYLQEFGDLAYVFLLNPEFYNQSILERPEELQLLVRDFLISIQ